MFNICFLIIIKSLFQKKKMNLVRLKQLRHERNNSLTLDIHGA